MNIILYGLSLERNITYQNALVLKVAEKIRIRLFDSLEQEPIQETRLELPVQETSDPPMAEKPLPRHEHLSDYGSLRSVGSSGSFLHIASVSSPPESLLHLQGIDPEIFKEKVDPQFYCEICKKVLRWPMQTECGCRFCYSCIHKHIG